MNNSNHIPPGYKPSPLGPIPVDWEIWKLGDIGKIRMCKRVFNHETSENGDIPFYKIGTFGRKADAYISKELYNDYKQKFSFPKKGDILISAAGTLGRTVKYDGSPAYFQDSNIVWIDNNGEFITNDYLFYVYTIIKYDSEGGTIQRLYNNIISNAKFPLPPLPEQTAIANLLSTWDKAIQTTTQLIAQKEQRKKWLMQQLLTGKKRLKGFSGEWKEVKLKDYTRKVKGKVFEISELRRGLPCITATSFSGNYTEFTETNDAVTCDFKDVLILWDGENAGLVTTNHKGIIGSTVAKLVLNSQLNNFFLTYKLISDNNKLRAIREGSGIPHMPGDFEEWYHFLIPSYEEQTAIAAVLQAADKEVQLLKAKAEQLKEQKKGLMQQLLTGRKRLKMIKQRL
jgi:type I restriction enzyme, S subunit